MTTTTKSKPKKSPVPGTSVYATEDRSKDGLTRLPPYTVGRVVESLKELQKLSATPIKELTAGNASVAPLADSINWGQHLLGIPTVWATTQGTGVRVAVLDTGCDLDHPDLVDAIVESEDFTNNGSANDVDGHGTHCAGIIGARQNNEGFIGVAPLCDILVGKVLHGGTGSWQGIVSGIDWAVENEANIISMSLGGSFNHPDVYRAIHIALAEGIIVICAAGNSGAMHRNSIGYPGRDGAVITVAAHDSSGNTAGFSSHGGEIDFMTPGVDIWSTYKDASYATLSGTSMATPFVAGIAALVLSKHLATPSNDTPIENTADMVEHLGRMATHPGWHDSESGYGVLKPLMYFYGLTN